MKHAENDMYDVATISFLEKASLLLNNYVQNQDQLLLKSQIRCNLNERLSMYCKVQRGIQSSEICKRCGSKRKFKLKVLSYKPKMINFKKKLMKKSDLSRFKKKLLNFFNQRKDNILILTCLICKNRTKYGMTNPSKAIDNENVIKKNAPIMKIKKKKKKKDKFIGLAPTAVLRSKNKSYKSKTSLENSHNILSKSNILEKRFDKFKANSKQRNDGTLSENAVEEVRKRKVQLVTKDKIDALSNLGSPLRNIESKQNMYSSKSKNTSEILKKENELLLAHKSMHKVVESQRDLAKKSENQIDIGEAKLPISIFNEGSYRTHGSEWQHKTNTETARLVEKKSEYISSSDENKIKPGIQAKILQKTVQSQTELCKFECQSSQESSFVLLNSVDNTLINMKRRKISEKDNLIGNGGNKFEVNVISGRENNSSADVRFRSAIIKSRNRKKERTKMKNKCRKSTKKKNNFSFSYFLTPF